MGLHTTPLVELTWIQDSGCTECGWRGTNWSTCERHRWRRGKSPNDAVRSMNDVDIVPCAEVEYRRVPPWCCCRRAESGRAEPGRRCRALTTYHADTEVMPATLLGRRQRPVVPMVDWWPSCRQELAASTALTIVTVVGLTDRRHACQQAAAAGWLVKRWHPAYRQGCASAMSRGWRGRVRLTAQWTEQHPRQSVDQAEWWN